MSNISYIIPAYNCENTIISSIRSIYHGNFTPGDEIIVVDDCSTDNTEHVVRSLHIPIRFSKNMRNLGGGPTRNIAVSKANNKLIFCLDSDNQLAPKSMQYLKKILIESKYEVAAFQEIRYFTPSRFFGIQFKKVTHHYYFDEKISYDIHDYLHVEKAPGSSGNYLYTKQSWIDAGGYLENVGALDTWSFGFKQALTGSRTVILPNYYYLHRYGHESYWVRESRKEDILKKKRDLVQTYENQLNAKDFNYYMSNKIWEK